MLLTGEIYIYKTVTRKLIGFDEIAKYLRRDLLILQTLSISCPSREGKTAEIRRKILNSIPYVDGHRWQLGVVSFQFRA